MGAAESSNVATAISNVANFVNNSTSANTSQVNKQTSNLNLENCMIKLSGNLTNTDSAKLMVTNNQIIGAKQDSNVNNNIQQQMLQQAQSTIGSMGLGYASASNSATEMANCTNQVVNAMMVGCNQYSSVNNNFTCSNSTIIAKNMNIGFDSITDFLSSQTLNNDQVANLSNNISQTIQQKATATVEGISGLLIMIILAIGLVIFSVLKPLSSGSLKIVLASIICLVCVVVIMVMYVNETPPFFNEPKECINNSTMGMGGKEGNIPSCINQQNKKINLTNPPFKYLYGITPDNNSQPGGNLLQMAISANSGQNQTNSGGVNGGYRADVYNTLDKIINDKSTQSTYNSIANKYNIPNIPNPLVVPTGSNGSYYQIPAEYGGQTNNNQNENICTPGTIQIGGNNEVQNFSNCPSIASIASFTSTNEASQGIANLNIEDWNDYLNMTGKYKPNINNINPSNSNADNAETRALFARFVLSDLVGNIDLHHYVTDDDFVKFLDDNNNIIIGKAKDIKNSHPNDIYQYHPYSTPGTWSNGTIGSGFIQGQVGVTDDNTNKFYTFMQNIGGYIMLGFAGLIGLFMFYTWYKNRK